MVNLRFGKFAKFGNKKRLKIDSVSLTIANPSFSCYEGFTLKNLRAKSQKKWKFNRPEVEEKKSHLKFAFLKINYFYSRKKGFGLINTNWRNCEFQFLINFNHSITISRFSYFRFN